MGSALTLDARNYKSPIPLIKTKAAMIKLKVGDVIEVLFTDPVCKNVIPDWVKRVGHKIVNFEEIDNDSEKFYKITIIKTW